MGEGVVLGRGGRWGAGSEGEIGSSSGELERVRVSAVVSTAADIYVDDCMGSLTPAFRIYSELERATKNQRPQPPPGSQGRLLHPGDFFGAGLSRGTMCFPVYRHGESSGCVFF
jgi:hypothetical protein